MGNRPPLLFPPFAMLTLILSLVLSVMGWIGSAVHAGLETRVLPAVALAAENNERINDPAPLGATWWVQLGFIGAFIVAMWIMFWLIKARRVDWQTWMKTLVEQNRETGQALQNNTTAFVQLNGTLAKLCEKLTSEEAYSHKVYEALMQRPCLVATVGSKRAAKLLADLHKELAKDGSEDHRAG